METLESEFRDSKIGKRITLKIVLKCYTIFGQYWNISGWLNLAHDNGIIFWNSL